MLRMVREVDPPRPSTKVEHRGGSAEYCGVRGIEPAEFKR